MTLIVMKVEFDGMRCGLREAWNEERGCFDRGGLLRESFVACYFSWLLLHSPHRLSYWNICPMLP